MVAAVAKKTREPSLGFIAFLQALGLFIYCALVALLFWRGNQWFGSVPNFFGPLLFLILFVTSALISALVTLGYPIILFWEKRQRVQAIRLVLYTAGWLAIFLLFIMLYIFAYIPN